MNTVSAEAVTFVLTIINSFKCCLNSCNNGPQPFQCKRIRPQSKQSNISVACVSSGRSRTQNSQALWRCTVVWEHDSCWPMSLSAMQGNGHFAATALNISPSLHWCLAVQKGITHRISTWWKKVISLNCQNQRKPVLWTAERSSNSWCRVVVIVVVVMRRMNLIHRRSRMKCTRLTIRTASETCADHHCLWSKVLALLVLFIKECVFCFHSEQSKLCHGDVQCLTSPFLSMRSEKCTCHTHSFTEHSHASCSIEWWIGRIECCMHHAHKCLHWKCSTAAQCHAVIEISAACVHCAVWAMDSCSERIWKFPHPFDKIPLPRLILPKARTKQWAWDLNSLVDVSTKPDSTVSQETMTASTLITNSFLTEPASLTKCGTRKNICHEAGRAWADIRENQWILSPCQKFPWHGASTFHSIVLKPCLLLFQRSFPWHLFQTVPLFAVSCIRCFCNWTCLPCYLSPETIPSCCPKINIQQRQHPATYFRCCSTKSIATSDHVQHMSPASFVLVTCTSQADFVLVWCQLTSCWLDNHTSVQNQHQDLLGKFFARKHNLGNHVTACLQNIDNLFVCRVCKLSRQEHWSLNMKIAQQAFV